MHDTLRRPLHATTAHAVVDHATSALLRQLVRAAKRIFWLATPFSKARALAQSPCGVSSAPLAAVHASPWTRCLCALARPAARSGYSCGSSCEGCRKLALSSTPSPTRCDACGWTRNPKSSVGCRRWHGVGLGRLSLVRGSGGNGFVPRSHPGAIHDGSLDWPMSTRSPASAVAGNFVSEKTGRGSNWAFGYADARSVEAAVASVRREVERCVAALIARPLDGTADMDD